MKICAAQIRPIKGDIDRNIVNHKKIIDVAISGGANIIVFPELSITGYEPKLCAALATDQEDKRLDEFQVISDGNNITICVGLPSFAHPGVMISMIIFQPNQPRQTYSKQHLHEDEFPYFSPGEHQVLVTIDKSTIAPAICYESLLPEHAENAFRQHAEIYIASVAKSASGVAKAFIHYPAIAKQYGMTVVMANCVGPCDDFESFGSSSVWNNKGIQLEKLNDSSEGILMYDVETYEIIKVIVESEG